MFEFENRDEGFRVLLAGEMICSIQTKRLMSSIKDRNVIDTLMAIPKEKWEIHFTAKKLTPSQLAALAQEIESK